MATIFDGPIGRVQSKPDLVYERVCAAILGGRVKPGQRLNVDELARALGVSKIPVREALQRLEAQGLVVQTPHAGARVAPVSLRELKGVFLIRIELEGLATRLAAPAIGDDDLAQLRAIHAEMQRRHAAGDLDNLSDLNRRFHRIIARAAGYRMLEELIETALLAVAHYRATVKADTALWRQSLEEHEAILAALANGDPDEAERAAQEHVRRQLEGDLQRQIAHIEQQQDRERTPRRPEPLVVVDALAGRNG